MKTLYLFSFLFLVFSNALIAQQKTTVIAHSIDISDNFDLRAVATLFGESLNLEDFERRLNDPEIKISNLDLNQDNEVDYLRVVEIVEKNQHFIVIQAVLGQDLMQDIATIEVDKETQTQRVQVQVVGNEYFYGTNYVYEPVFVSSPLIFNYFWQPYYVAYYSPWHWGYYPTYYHVWNPYPIYAYRNHIGLYINVNNFCYYRPDYRSHYFYSNHYRSYRSNVYERQNPNRSFINRNQGYANRNQLSLGRNTLPRNASGTRSQVNNRSNQGTRSQSIDLVQRQNRLELNSRNQSNNNRSLINRSPNSASTRATSPKMNSNSQASLGRAYRSQSSVSENSLQVNPHVAPSRAHSRRPAASTATSTGRATTQIGRSINQSLGGRS